VNLSSVVLLNAKPSDFHAVVLLHQLLLSHSVTHQLPIAIPQQECVLLYTKLDLALIPLNVEILLLITLLHQTFMPVFLANAPTFLSFHLELLALPTLTASLESALADFVLEPTLVEVAQPASTV